MLYSMCRNCSYVCSCCSARVNGARCSGCESRYDEFEPAENIKYCPLTGEKLPSEDNNYSKAEEGYTDSVGGYHESGVGYSPSGRFCGECCMNTCEGCKYAEV